jgi:hypothetical protein
MAIVRLEDKYKSKYKIQLTPERQYISSSSGITGSVYVFPNRSNTQKDNIDERLNLAPMVEEGTEFSGKPIRSYDANSLEARREEIFKGELNKMIGGAFTDAIQYEYVVLTATNASSPAIGTSKTGELWNDQIISGTVTFYAGIPGDTIKRIADGRVFEWSSDGEWLSQPEIFRKLPESDRDRSALKYDVALGMLLDGTHPFTEDHAWRKDAAFKAQLYIDDPSTYSAFVDYSLGNSSFTSASTLADKEKYQFTGMDIFTDELGIPYLDSPVISKDKINPWPPEIKNTQVIANWMLSGYSDLSMHPRNATKKEVVLTKANHDLFSSGSARQRVLANRIDELDAVESGWWTHNYQCLSLHKYSTYKPFLVYDASDYAIDWTSSSCQVMFEFWVKPCKEQDDVGTICQLSDNYAIVLIPDYTSEKNGVYEKFKLGFYNDNAAVKNASISWSTAFPTTTAGDYWISPSSLYLDNWHHVAIRFGRNFNNGQLNVYIDGKALTPEDGVYNTSIGRQGVIDVVTGTSAGDYLLIGGWENNSALSDLYTGAYAAAQNQGSATSPVYGDGYAVTCNYHLRSELMDLRIWSQVRPEKDILLDKNRTLTSTTNLSFYLPMLFDPQSDTPQWSRLGFLPDQENPKTSEDYYKNGSYLTINNANLPYNKTQFCTNSAYIVGMPFVNVHSHLREYVKGAYPVVAGYPDFTDAGLGSSINVYPIVDNESTREGTAVVPEVYTGLEYFQKNWKSLDWLQSLNSLILPCDNPLFEVRTGLCGTNIHNFIENSYLRLNGLGIGSTTDEYEIKHFYDDEVFAIQNTIIKTDPQKKVFKGKVENYQTATLVAENKLEDNDYISPISTIFSVPQIYYGNRIHPTSIELSYTTVSGKKITIIDNEGALYRKDCKQLGHTSKVGHVDYGNGLICIFSPLLTGIGIDNFTLKLKGEKNLHVMQLDIPCNAGVANISQHPSYKKLKPTLNSNETDGNVTYISTIYLHDENLNIIGKVNLAQPVQKREEDSYIFRVKLDF